MGEKEADPWSDGDGDGNAAAGRNELDQEWRSRQQQFHTLGYRDGLTAGKESSAQKGFDAGFKESIDPGFDWGVARGITSAFAALASKHQELLIPDEDSRDDLASLQKTISSTSSNDAIVSYHGHHIVRDASFAVADVLDLSTQVKSLTEKASICYCCDGLHGTKRRTAEN